MSNLLKMAISETIRTLHRRGWSQRRIADELGINRETVARHLRQADPRPKPANAPPGSDSRPTARQNQPMRPPARRTSRRHAPDQSRLRLPARRLIHSRRGSGRRQRLRALAGADPAKCDLGLSAQRIYQDLVTEHGFAGSYYSVRRFVRRLGADTRAPLPPPRVRAR